MKSKIHINGWFCFSAIVIVTLLCPVSGEQATATEGSDKPKDDGKQTNSIEVSTSIIPFTAPKHVEIGHVHHFNMTPITGRGRPSDYDDLQKPSFYGSTPIPIVDHPYVASILRNGQMVGVGTLVSDYWVLTTAYNALYSPRCYLRIRVGSSSPYVFGRNYFVNARAIYPRYNYTWRYSLGMLKSDTKIELNRHIQILSLADYMRPSHFPVKVVGFGTNSKHWQTLLEEINVYYHPSKLCDKMFKDAEDMNNEMMFCVVDTRRGPCHYNFGAPVLDTDRRRLVGLYLGTHKCDVRRSYGAYIDVTIFRKWVENVAFLPFGITSSGQDFRSKHWPSHVSVNKKSSSSDFYVSGDGQRLSMEDKSTKPSEEADSSYNDIQFSNFDK